MAKINFIQIQGLYSYPSKKTTIHFGKKNLIVGTNDSGKSSIFKALDFFLKTLYVSGAHSKNPWTSQDNHEMTVGLTLDSIEKRYLMEILSVIDVNHQNSVFILSPPGMVEHLMSKFDDVQITIKWHNTQFEDHGHNIQYFLKIPDLGIVIYSKGFNRDPWVTTESKPNFNYSPNKLSFVDIVNDVGFKDKFVKEEFSKAFDQSESIKISQFPPSNRFANNPKQSQLLDSANVDRINWITKWSENQPYHDRENSFFTMLGYLLRHKFSYISEQRSFQESNDLEKLPLKDDGSNLQGYLFWLQNSDKEDKRKMYVNIKKSFEEIMKSQRLSFDLSIIKKETQPKVDSFSESSDNKIYPDRVTVVFNNIQLEDQRSINFTSVGAGIQEILFLLTKCLGQQDGIILMDEPATNLHPTRIRRLMDKIFSYSDTGHRSNQIIIITHSPVLANLELLSSVSQIIRIYKKSRTSIVIQPSEKNKKWLAENLATFHQLKSDILFAHGVILVEGPSDRIFLETILNYGKKFDIEDEEDNIVVLDVGGFKSFPKFRQFLEIFEIPYVLLADNDDGEKFRDEKIRKLKPTSDFNDKNKEECEIVYLLEKDLEFYLASLDQSLYKEILKKYNPKPEKAYHFVNRLFTKKIPDGVKPIIFMIQHLNRLCKYT